jgi:hypothetical protein
MISPVRFRITLLSVFLFSCLNSGFAAVTKQTKEDILINCFFNNLYNFSFRAADSLVVIINDSNIDRCIVANIKANLAWWKILSGDAINSNLRRCDSSLNESIRLAPKIKQKEIGSLLNIIFSYSLRARLENYRGNTLKSAIYFYKSITYIEECLNQSEKDEKLNLVSGLYFYFMDYLENEYFMVRAMFFHFRKGDKAKGLALLEECSRSGNEMISTEANYFLMKIYADIEIEYSRAYLNALTLTGQHPDNLVYNYEELLLLLKMKKTGEARIFRKKMVDEILKANNINTLQKNHFISQLEKLTGSFINR